MYPPVSQQMMIAWTVTPLPVSDEGIEPPVCRECEVDLNVHQPDEGRPEHLLGTCPCCGAWYLIELNSELTEAFLIDMPNVSLIHSAAAPTRKKLIRKRLPRYRQPSDERAVLTHNDQVA
jgi:hypothetical protein